MRLRTTAFLSAILWCGLPAHAQQAAQTAPPTVIRTETRLVLVDAVVTDKKGNYVPDLSQKDFKVFEDNKEQAISSFTFEADPNSPANNQKHYLVLFFDNASVSTGNQMQARAAAIKFVDRNTGPNNFIAVVNFSGTLQVAQNFTNDSDRLKDVINGVKLSTVSTSGGGMPGARGSGPASLGADAQFGISSVLMGIREMAKRLSDVPGRKMVVMLTEGFRLNSELQSEMAATIDACNKFNVSIYPVDVRGLAAPTPMPGGRGIGGRQNRLPMALFGSPAGPSLGMFVNSFQVRGGGGTGSGTGGGSTGGGGIGAGSGSGGAGGSRGGTGTGTGGTGTGSGTSGSRGGTGTGTGTGTTGTAGGRGGTGTGTTTNGGRGGVTPVNPSLTGRPPVNPRTIVPTFPSGIDANQDALYQLAGGTGGFVIVNTNDLLGGMEKIAREQNQYYIIGFAPAESAEGTCHTLHVKVDKGGNSVRSRSGYCNVRQVDVLAGKPVETELEAIAAGSAGGNLGSPLQLPFFYASPNVARVNVAMDIPSTAFKFAKEKGKLHAEMNVLGVAYRADNSVAAKFSDTLKFDYDNKVQVEEFARLPVHYENQFDISSGQYNVKVVFSTGGDNFGKIEKPLAIEPFDGKEFAVSALALSKELRPTAEDSSLDAVLIEDRVPLVALGMQAIPAAQYNFDAGDNLAGIYFEIFDPGLAQESPPDLFTAISITDKKSGQVKLSSGKMEMKQYLKPGNPLVPVILKLPVKDLPPGAYHLDVGSADSTGKQVVRSADFDITAATAPAVGWGKN